MSLEKDFKLRLRNQVQRARINMYVTNSLLMEKFDGSLKGAGLTGSQFNILRILRGQATKTLSISGIKERMLDKNSDVSRLVEKLVLKGFVGRKENTEDRRLKDVSITKEGLDVLASLDQCELAMDDYLDMLSEAEVKSLNNILDKIREGVKARSEHQLN